MSEIPELKVHPKWVDIATSFSVVVEKKADEFIMEEGEIGRLMYVVLSGEVRIILGEKDGETIGPGGIVGEMSLLDVPIRSASAVAVGDTRLAQIGTELFLRLVREEPPFSLFVMNTLAHRLRRMNELLKPDTNGHSY